MSNIATVDNKNRLQLPPEAKDWFPPGARFLVVREGDTVTLKPVSDLAAHLAAVEAAGNDDAMSWEEIDAEIQTAQ